MRKNMKSLCVVTYYRKPQGLKSDQVRSIYFGAFSFLSIAFLQLFIL